MSKIAKIFATEDGKTVWSYNTANGEYHTTGVDVTEEGFALVDGVPRISVERNIVWAGHNNTEVLARQSQAMVDMLNAGKLRAYKAFSETPFYEGDKSNILPASDTNEEKDLGRYSQARMCTPEDYLKLHKQFVVVEASATPPVVTEQPKIEA